MHRAIKSYSGDVERVTIFFIILWRYCFTLLCMKIRWSAREASHCFLSDLSVELCTTEFWILPIFPLSLLLSFIFIIIFFLQRNNLTFTTLRCCADLLYPWALIAVTQELHVIDGIPQLIFVRASYTIEVWLDPLFSFFIVFHLMPTRVTELFFLFSKTVEAERISVDHVAHLKPSDGGSAATQCEF